MAEEHEFAIPVRDLDAGGKSFGFPVRVAWLRSALESTQVQAGGKDGTLELRLSKSGTDVVVRGAIQADLVVPCSRCLEPAAVHIREDVSVLVVPASAMREPSAHGDGDEDDIAPDEADVIAYDGETVVLDALIRDELLLAIPMIPLCSEGCPGMSAHSNPNNLNEQLEAAIDPRLRPLLRLKKQSQ
jgi:uncharacterized protein